MYWIEWTIEAILRIFTMEFFNNSNVILFYPEKFLESIVWIVDLGHCIEYSLIQKFPEGCLYSFLRVVLLPTAAERIPNLSIISF
ncbi:Uncharacterized protein NV38_0002426 [Leptospira kirschneri serovar Mozdok]|nr:Uncharacterized protein NV38_0002426 [Leptospira kirschneri serovar Mozdok]